MERSAHADGLRAVLRALAFKWVRILYRCWVNETEYDESKYLKHLRARNAQSWPPQRPNIELAAALRARVRRPPRHVHVLELTVRIL
jgi:hypothetical protein